MGLGVFVNGFLQIGRAYGAEQFLPMRGEGAANENCYYSFGVRHCYDGAQGTARPTKFRFVGGGCRSKNGKKEIKL